MEPKFQVNLTTFGYISDWLFWAQSAERKRAFDFYFVKRWWFENGWKGEWRNHANAQRSQRWFQEIKEPSKQAKPTWIQPDPCRSFPNKRSGGRRAKCSHLWQPWNIGRTIAGFHCTVPDFANPLAASSGFYCFFPHSATLSRFRTGSPQQPPLTLKPLRQAVIEAAVLWNHPLATTFFAAIRPYTDLVEPRCNRSAAFSCNLCPRARPVRHRASSPIGSDYIELANDYIWLQKIATCLRSFTIYDDQKCHWKSGSAKHGGLQLHFIDRNLQVMEPARWISPSFDWFSIYPAFLNKFHFWFQPSSVRFLNLYPHQYNRWCMPTLPI